jgi:hypothetical protein
VACSARPDPEFGDGEASLDYYTEMILFVMGWSAGVKRYMILATSSGEFHSSFEALCDLRRGDTKRKVHPWEY